MLGLVRDEPVSVLTDIQGVKRQEQLVELVDSAIVSLMDPQSWSPR